ncbi:MAG: glucuronate isomerase [Oscillospiraceae bacterium]|nr:glucuronate isomerase [Oscillospiraceae bacterium]
MNENYLLTTPLAQQLYHQVAKDLPIIDYHNHLCVADIRNNRQFQNLYEIWLATDPYKHRLMRICGVEEAYITGDKAPYEKFQKWCEVFGSLAGTPVYDWSLAELQNVFGIDLVPAPETAREIWDTAEKLLATPAFSAGSYLEKFNVEYAAPCAGIREDVSAFEDIPGLAPSLRADDILLPDKTFLQELSQVSNVSIVDLQTLTEALATRISRFAKAGCKFSDHALDNGFVYIRDDGKNQCRLQTVLSGETLSPADTQALRSEMLRILGKLYCQYHMTMQLHIGAQRYTSTRLRNLVGPAGGFAGIGNTLDVQSLTALLDDLEQTEGLPKTIVFTLNPADNGPISILSGSYARDGVPALVTQGPAWWWCDHMQGIKQMLNEFASFSVLSTFVGMTTDSRSLLSFSRHDYFRRVLCMWIGEKVAAGELPADFSVWKPIVEKICYQNAKELIQEGK